MSATIVDFSPVKVILKDVTAGDDITIFMTVTQDGDPVDLTDYEFKCQFREQDGTLVYDMAEGSGITITPLIGKVDIVGEGSATENYTCDTTLNYDVQVVRPDGYKKTWISGTCKIIKQITTG